MSRRGKSLHVDGQKTEKARENSGESGANFEKEILKN